jgi:hypothetical protein
MSIVSVRLIHPLGGFLAELEPGFSQVIARYQERGITRQSFARWIIAKQLEEVFGIYCAEHCALFTWFNEPYETLQRPLHFEIAQCFTAYFKNIESYPSEADITLFMMPNDTIMVTYTFNQPRYYRK